jgi:uncharacterized GH25 family protein
MQRFVRHAAVALACGLAFAAAHAHTPWLLPSSTVLSAPQWVTIDGAVTTDPFVFDHNALNIDKVVITAPDGSVLAAENASKGKLRSTFDVNLQQKGTYKMALNNEGVSASYKLDGQQKRWRGEAVNLEKEIPATATDLNVTQSYSRLETFVTVGAPTQQVFKPTGVGLELVPLTHPNDLVKGEPGRFRFDIDGKPAPGVSVTVFSAGSRYRSGSSEQTLTTDAGGVVQIQWMQPGMVWVGASAKDNKTSVKQAKERRLSYGATFEVMP